MYGPSLLWAEFVSADFVMGRVCNGPSLLWAEMSSYPFKPLNITTFVLQTSIVSEK